MIHLRLYLNLYFCVQLSHCSFVLIVAFALVNRYGIIFEAVYKAIHVIDSPAPFPFFSFKRFWFSFTRKRGTGHRLQETVYFFQYLCFHYSHNYLFVNYFHLFFLYPNLLFWSYPNLLFFWNYQNLRFYWNYQNLLFFLNYQNLLFF